jgi:hypothetical protein
MTKEEWAKWNRKMQLNSIYGTNLCKEIILPGTTHKLINMTVKFDYNNSRSKYKFSRKWYVADHNYEDYDAVIAWCTEQFGPRPLVPDAWTRWHNTYIDQIQFRDKADYEWFILKWGT